MIEEGEDADALRDAIDSFTAADTILLWVHGPQADAAAQAAGLSIDWKGLPRDVAGAGTLVGVIYHDPDDGDALRGEFHDELARNQFTVRPKGRRGRTPSEREEAHHALDIDFALDVLQTSLLRAETLFLCVNDARFVPLVRALQSRGRRVFIVSSRKVLARELARAADKPLAFLEDLQGQSELQDDRPGGN